MSGAVHHYAATVDWSGSTGAGYEAYARDHDARVPPARASFTLSSDPAFRGNPALANPEQLLLLAAASCQLLSFLAVAARARIDVVAYHDDAAGEMPERDGPMRITRITLRPRITIRGDVPDERLHHLVEVAHRECFIANTVTADLVIEARILRTGV
jgi:organic hydroperoxide reductase OsmC/OhrA